jgi:hypothetical protein
MRAAVVTLVSGVGWHGGPPGTYWSGGRLSHLFFSTCLNRLYAVSADRSMPRRQQHHGAYVGLRGDPSRAMAARLTCFDTGWRFESGGLFRPFENEFRTQPCDGPTLRIERA